MFSVSPAEIITIVVVALVVFGPRRLPEIARRVGRVARDLKGAADELRADFEKEYEETLAPLDEARRAIGDTLAGEERTPPSTEDDPDEGDSERDDT